MKRRRGSSSPLLTMTPAAATRRQLQLRLPDGWSVEEKPRSFTNSSRPGRVDRYYIEPDTGMKFRSLVAVHRYLSDGKIDTSASMQITPDQKITPLIKTSPHFMLPDGWEIEEKPRKNTKTALRDKYYIEPGTGRRFRSLVAVERYLTEDDEHTPLQALIPAIKSFVSSSSGSKEKKIRSLELGSKKSPYLNESNSTLETPRPNTYSELSKDYSSTKKIISGETDRPLQLNSSSSSMKVKWVLTCSQGNVWNPFINDSRVADSVKQKWSKIFMSSIYDENIKPPRF